MAAAYLVFDGARFSPEKTGGAARLDYRLELDGKTIEPESVSVEPDRIIAEFGPGGRIIDQLQDLGDGLIEITRSWNLNAVGELRLFFDSFTEITPERWIVPSVMYDGNSFGSGSFPTGGPEVGWSFREDRIAIPSCSIIADKAGALGVAAAPATEQRFLSGVTTRAEAGGVALIIEIPFFERPYAYRRKFYLGAGGSPPIRHTLRSDGRFSYERKFYLYSGPGGGYFYQPFINRLLDRTTPPDSAAPDWGKILRLKTEHAYTNYYFERGHEAGFLTYVSARHLPLINSFQAGFLGRGLELSYSLYRTAFETGADYLIDRARKAADFFLGGRVGNGLFFTDYQLARRRWVGLNIPYRPKEVNTRTMGEEAINYLRLFRLASERGAANPEWEKMPLGLGRFMVENLPADGNPGKWWSVDGRRTDPTSSNGAYLAPLLVELAAHTGDEKYLQTAARIGDYYLRAAVAAEVYAGDTLDADCIDKEAGHAVLKCLNALYRATGDRRYHEGAQKAAAYIATWIYGYDVSYGPETKLGRHNFRTSGCTSVSVAHHHLDPYGIAIGLDLLDLHADGGDEFWRRLAARLIDNCSQLVADENDRLGYPPGFEGHQPEQVVHTDWSYYLPAVTPRGSFFSNILWVPSLTIGALLDLRAQYPASVGFDIQTPHPRPPIPLLNRMLRSALSRINFVA